MFGELEAAGRAIISDKKVYGDGQGHTAEQSADALYCEGVPAGDEQNHHQPYPAAKQ